MASTSAAVCCTAPCPVTGRVPSTSRKMLRDGPYSRSHPSPSSMSRSVESGPVALPLCTLPPEQCPIAGEVCDSDCWTETAIPCAALDHCVVIPCTADVVGPDCMVSCDTSCDQWMDWLRCDGSACYTPPAEAACVDCATPSTSAGAVETSSTTAVSLTSFPTPALHCHQQPYVSAHPSSLRAQMHQPWRCVDQTTHTANHIPPTSAPVSRHSPNQAPYSQQHLVPSPNQPLPAARTSDSRVFCLWGECRETFSLQADLITHVNQVHLGVDTSVVPTSNVRERDALACHWADCGIQLPLEGPAAEEGEPISMLASHLLQEHLGLRSLTDVELLLSSLSGSSSSLGPAGLGPDTSSDGNAKWEMTAVSAQGTMPSTLSSSLSYRGPTSLQQTPPQLKLSPRHISTSPPVTVVSDASSSTKPFLADTTPQPCRWTSCNQTFDGVDALSAHILSDHIGGGKREYSCHWEDCDRNGSRAFSSKQKIMRHLQAHTGHKPFECIACGQHFSEAATLQQHTRRHTSEKPYVCDTPGCGKTFAVAGALTIHKRTHTGLKPFKCTHCDKTFAESSNLAKHIRTHTGAKPYLCTEPGCEKRFCRPDQLNRHRSVHVKRGSVEASETVSLSDVDMDGS